MTVQVQPELLAHHYTEAGLNEQAIGYWQRAGETAKQRSAHVEVIAHLNKGLELLAVLPDTPQRCQQELTLHIALGPSLVATKGYAAPEVEQTYNRAQALCQIVDEAPQLFQVLHLLRSFYLVRAELQSALELNEHMLRLAQRLQGPWYLLNAHMAIGHTLLHLGELQLACTHLEQGKAVYTSQRSETVMPLSAGGLDPGMFCQAWLAAVLWTMGYPNKALQNSDEALAIAQERAHPFSLSTAIGFSTRIHRWRGELQTAYEREQMTMDMASEGRFAQSVSEGTIRQGLRLTEQGEVEEGLALVRQGVAAYHATGAVVRQPLWFAPLAAALLKAEQVEDGLTVIAEALEHVNQAGECWWEAELHRLKGELLLAQSTDNATEAESQFHQAISIAHHQSAKSWELRAAISLAKLWQSQGKVVEARDLLAPVYEWFTEGFDTVDLIDAKVLLDELS